MPNLAEHSRGAEIDAQWARWLGVGSLAPHGGRWQLVASPAARPDRVTWLRCEGVAVIRCHPQLAAGLEPAHLPPPHAASANDLAAALGWMPVEAAPRRQVLYLDAAWLVRPEATVALRPLSTAEAADRRAFATLCAACTPAEVERAEIALDQPQPIGAFVRGKLASVASYLLPGGPIADVGILTHPAHRGQGIGRAAAAACCEAALAQALIPQWWSLVSNPASLAVARSLGFRHFGFEEGLFRPAA